MSARSVTLGAFAFLVSMAAAVSAGGRSMPGITARVYRCGRYLRPVIAFGGAIPGQFPPGEPEIVVQNVPGGGSLKLTKLMLGSEAADGSVIASVSPAMAFAPQLDPAQRRFRRVVDRVAGLVVRRAGILHHEQGVRHRHDGEVLDGRLPHRCFQPRTVKLTSWRPSRRRGSTRNSTS